MIEIKFHIQSHHNTKTKKIQFYKNNEENLNTIYGIITETIHKNVKCDWNQLMLICCFHLTNEIRKNTLDEIIVGKLIIELSKYQSVIQTLKNIQNMSIEAKIDNHPMRNLEFTFKIPSLTELQVLSKV